MLRRFDRPPLGDPFVINRHSPQAKGLVAWWPTNGVAPGTLSLPDLARNTAATINGATWTVHPDHGHILYYDGTNDYVNCAVTNLQFGTGDYTIVAWAATTDDSDFNYLASGNNDIFRPLYIRGATSTMRMALGWSYYSPASGSVIDTGELLCLVISVDRSANASFYIDGFLDEAVSVSGSSSANIAPTTFRLGNASDQASRWWGGLIGDVRMYNYALPESLVRHIYNPQTRWDLYQPTRRIWVVGAPASGVTGTSALTTEPAEVAATGSLKFHGTSALEAAIAELAATGSLRFTGTGSLETEAAESASTGVLKMSGTSALETEPATLASTGLLKFSGTGSLTTEPAEVAATGTAPHLGTGALATEPAEVAATGSLKFHGTATLETEPAEVAGTGTSGLAPVTGTSALSTEPAEVAGTATLRFSGNAALTTEPATSAATGKETMAGVAALSTEAATLAATGLLKFTGTAALTAEPATSAGAGTAPHLGTGALTAPAATLSATGLIVVSSISGTGALETAAVTVAATGTVALDPLGGTFTVDAEVRILTVSAETREFTVPAEDRTFTVL